MEQAWAVAGIDPHKDSFTVGIVDGRGGRCGIEAFAMTVEGFAELVEWIDAAEVDLGRIGVEGANGLGRQLARFLVAAGYDVRDVQSNRTAERRRRRRRQKTDREDAEAIARETLAHDDLPPAGKHETPDLVWDELVAVRNRRDSLLHQRVRLLNEAEAVLCAVALPVREQLPHTSRVRPRINALAAGAAEGLDLSAADEVHLGWLIDTAADVAELDRRIRTVEQRIPPLLAQLGTTLTDEVGIGPVSAMELLVEIGDPARFRSEAQFARWCGAAPVAASSGEGRNEPVHHRFDLAGNRQVNSILHVMHITQARFYPPAKEFMARKRSNGKTYREARRAHKRQLANRVIRRMWTDQIARIANRNDASAAA
jgi:transposase